VNRFLWWKCLDGLDWNGLFFGVQSVDTVGRCTTSYLLAGPVCVWCLVSILQVNLIRERTDTTLALILTLTIKLVGNCCCCKDQLPPSNINLLEHIVRVKKNCLTLVCILHMLCGCKLLNAVKWSPNNITHKSNRQSKGLLGNPVSRMMCSRHVIDATHAICYAISICGTWLWSVSSNYWPSFEGIGAYTSLIGKVREIITLSQFVGKMHVYLIMLHFFLAGNC
jgi:hypothetical protein